MTEALIIIERKTSEIVIRIYALLFLACIGIGGSLLTTFFIDSSNSTLASSITLSLLILVTILGLFQLVKTIWCWGDIAQQQLSDNWKNHAENLFTFSVISLFAQAAFLAAQYLVTTPVVFFIVELLDTIFEGAFFFLFFRYAYAMMKELTVHSYNKNIQLFKIGALAVYGTSFVCATLLFITDNTLFDTLMNILLLFQIPIIISLLYTLHCILKEIRKTLPEIPTSFFDTQNEIASDQERHDHDHDHDHTHEHHHDDSDHSHN